MFEFNAKETQTETKRKLDRHNSPVWREFCVIVSCMCWPHRIKAKETRGSFCFISHPLEPWRTTRKQIEFWDLMKCTIEMKLDSLPKIWIEKNSTNILLFTKKVNKKFVLIIFISSQHCIASNTKLSVDSTFCKDASCYTSGQFITWNDQELQFGLV